jgi:tetratricopeptide (TPR) repeat protein
LGEKHPDTMRAMKNLGGPPILIILFFSLDWYYAINYLTAVYACQNRFKEAESLYTKCLEYRETVLGESDAETLRMVNSLAKLFMNEGKYDDAEILLIRCLEVIFNKVQYSSRNFYCFFKYSES